eukprot:scaffold88861_cov60-Phaeocystis_antarctica.AAC.2
MQPSSNSAVTAVGRVWVGGPGIAEATTVRSVLYSDAVSPTAASHEVCGPAPLRWPSGGMVAPNFEDKRGCVCSVDEEGSPRGNGHTGNGHPCRLQQPGCTGR